MSKKRQILLLVDWQDQGWLIAGFYDTPEEAYEALDRHWNGYKRQDFKMLSVKEIRGTQSS